MHVPKVWGTRVGLGGGVSCGPVGGVGCVYVIYLGSAAAPVHPIEGLSLATSCTNCCVVILNDCYVYSLLFQKR